MVSKLILAGVTLEDFKGEPGFSGSTAGNIAPGSSSGIDNFVGYDDNRRYRSTRGMLLIRTSWGPDWGDGGYGWLPYDYVTRELAADFWTALNPKWLASGEFRCPLRRD